MVAALRARSIANRAPGRTTQTRSPRAAAVYNIGGGRQSNCSMLEAITACEQIAGRKLDWTLGEDNRIGDHRWCGLNRHIQPGDCQRRGPARL